MKVGKFWIFGAIGFVCLLFVAIREFQSSEVNNGASFQAQPREGQYETSLKKPAVNDDDGINSLSANPQEILGYARRQNARPKESILNELEILVAQEKVRYEEIFNEYKNAIKEYEDLSSNFDELVREDAPPHTRFVLDGEMQKQAQAILALQQKTNLAYTTLMAKYDEVVPTIVAKHF